MKTGTMIFLCCLVTFTSCKKKSDQPQVIKTLKTNLPSDFEIFYEKFHADSVFQMAHIVFPLEGYPAVTDSNQYVPTDFKWQKENWILHRPYNDGDGEFSRSFLNFNNIITEEISDGSGQFTMMRRFAKLSDDWHLIYYKEMGL